MTDPALVATADPGGTWLMVAILGWLFVAFVMVAIGRPNTRGK